MCGGWQLAPLIVERRLWIIDPNILFSDSPIGETCFKLASVSKHQRNRIETNWCFAISLFFLLSWNHPIFSYNRRPRTMNQHPFPIHLFPQSYFRTYPLMSLNHYNLKRQGHQLGGRLGPFFGRKKSRLCNRLDGDGRGCHQKTPNNQDKSSHCFPYYMVVACYSSKEG